MPDDVSAQMCLPRFCLEDNREDGDSSPSLRMTCSAISIGETCPSGLGTNCHPEERFVKVGRTFLPARLNSWHGNGDGKKACPACSRTVVPWKATGRRRLRANVFTACLALRTIEQTGDSSPSLRMTCFAISIGETCRSGLGTNCHPEEAFRLTKDLLQRLPAAGRSHDARASVTRAACQAIRQALLPSPRRGGAGGGVAVSLLAAVSVWLHSGRRTSPPCPLSCEERGSPTKRCVNTRRADRNVRPTFTPAPSTSRGSGQATTTPGRWSGHSCLLTYIKPNPGCRTRIRRSRRRLNGVGVGCLCVRL